MNGGFGALSHAFIRAADGKTSATFPFNRRGYEMKNREQALLPIRIFSLPHGHNVLCLVEWRHIERLGAVPEYHHAAHVGNLVSAEGEQRHQRAFKLLHGADED